MSATALCATRKDTRRAMALQAALSRPVNNQKAARPRGENRSETAAIINPKKERLYFFVIYRYLIDQGKPPRVDQYQHHKHPQRQAIPSACLQITNTPVFHFSLEFFF